MKGLIKIIINYQGQTLVTGIEKFGALVGDGTKIGANSVLSPGTILLPDSIVKRLELVGQSACS
jgi:acetyltransferase-like isoleucine patch superfamily enzyme